MNIDLLEQSARRTLGICLLLIAYGSLYPFTYESPSLGVWHSFAGSLLRPSSIPDLLGNVGLFIPVGLCVAQIGPHKYSCRSGLLALCVLFALLLQVFQVFVAGRIPVLSDVLWNTVGLLVGFVFGLWGRRLYQPRAARLLVKPIPFLLALLWVVSELPPFVPSLDIGFAKSSLKPLMGRDGIEFAAVWLAFAPAMTVGYLLRLSDLGRHSGSVLALLVLVVVAGKVLVLSQQLTMELLLGVGAALLATEALRVSDDYRHRILVVASLVIACLLGALRPFEVASSAGTFNFVPFADLLGRNMLENLQSLLPRLYLFALLLGLLGRGFGLPLALLVLGLELLQLWIPGRSSSISDPLWVLFIAWVMPLIDRSAGSTSITQRGSTPRQRPRQSIKPAKSMFLVGFMLLVLLAATVVYAAVRLPGVPYNVQELLRGGTSFLACVFFVIGGLSLGAAAPIANRFLRPYRYDVAWVLPVALLISGSTTLFLLGFAVTKESISDIAGSTNLFYYVTKEQIWGPTGVWLFENLFSPGFVRFFERPVRFSALFAPLTFFLIVFCRIRLLPKVSVLRFVLLSIPALWLAKAIAFDWSSTDNLNELIARPGTYGLGGGGFLYALTALLAYMACRAALSRGDERLVTAILFPISIPLSWWLLNQGLEPQVHKYGSVFSGVQFLLGPDRKQLLPQETLMIRWSLVYVVGVVGLGAGVAAAIGMLHGARPGVKGNDKISLEAGDVVRESERVEAAAFSALSVNITIEQQQFISELAKQLDSDLGGTFQRIVEQLLSERGLSQLEGYATTSLSERGGGAAGEFEKVTLPLSADAEAALRSLASSASVSPSRAARRLLGQFMIELMSDSD
ncbi:VanZ family protein [Congregibacter variabilis]|uniref:VanZ family protein n=1 Tax=Congregibacter variabilis TaxID=3081200 RepID=A0ABZ0I682_9GAMM|nr:VanZ family protein [Congregibacter sp. IMCC43200]